MQTTFREWNNDEHCHQLAMRSTFVRNEARSSDSYFPSALEAADGVLNLALYIVGLPSDSSLASHCLANDLFDGAFDFLRRSDGPMPAHHKRLNGSGCGVVHRPFGLEVSRTTGR
jgi:hypothetical protein